jgi:hypothetical protein
VTTPLLRNEAPGLPNPFVIVVVVVRGNEAMGAVVDDDEGLPKADDEGVGEKNRGGGEPR